MNEPGPEKSGGIQLAERRKKRKEREKERKKAEEGERSVKAVKNRRDQGRGSHGMMMLSLRINCCRKKKSKGKVR